MKKLFLLVFVICSYSSVFGIFGIKRQKSPEIKLGDIFVNSIQNMELDSSFKKDLLLKLANNIDYQIIKDKPLNAKTFASFGVNIDKLIENVLRVNSNNPSGMQTDSLKTRQSFLKSLNQEFQNNGMSETQVLKEIDKNDQVLETKFWEESGLSQDTRARSVEQITTLEPYVKTPIQELNPEQTQQESRPEGFSSFSSFQPTVSKYSYETPRVEGEI